MTASRAQLPFNPAQLQSDLCVSFPSPFAFRILCFWAVGNLSWLGREVSTEGSVGCKPLCRQGLWVSVRACQARQSVSSQQHSHIHPAINHHPEQGLMVQLD